jgi:hypothetical protein
MKFNRMCDSEIVTESNVKNIEISERSSGGRRMVVGVFSS